MPTVEINTSEENLETNKTHDIKVVNKPEVKNTEKPVTDSTGNVQSNPLKNTPDNTGSKNTSNEEKTSQPIIYGDQSFMNALKENLNNAKGDDENDVINEDKEEDKEEAPNDYYDESQYEKKESDDYLDGQQDSFIEQESFEPDFGYESTTPLPKEKEKKDEKEEEEDDEILKLRKIDESNAYTADGFLPPQRPTLSMNIKTLNKIIDYQERQASEAFGINMLGYGWYQLFSIIEAVNEKYHPTDRFLGEGHGLKLKGISTTMQENLRRYRSSFRYIWRKMSTRKIEQVGPIVTMAMITADIIKNQHMHNVRMEMAMEAEEEIKRPMKAEDAVRFTRNKETNKETSKKQPVKTDAKEPVKEAVLSQPEVATIPDPDDIAIPESDNEIVIEDKENDDIVAVPQLPKKSPKKRNKKRN